ncbi:MAG: hypothetical protein EWV76_14780 [Microcystis novacekii Mn_MB_F_20050700_S1]|uniref:Uncharacterized protein n=1 Tax=Microcystis novacekii Mn_MB_F_20050700_S1D TaxID=2486266 RepID=A0A552J385_9CHRO|nr:MAG: hypothetical protein EWV76_14780 [Microcystis novacekii Mn_MB_F_20050700_S1]TRU90239.1 MAG: hypothetical protein EWV54_07105 [Microcystis novacekii Mn_MB_F_20050700_S1D]
MKFADLSSTALEKIQAVRWDRIIEKHEGPEDWKSVLRYHDVEFIEVAGRWILLPVERSSHPNIRILRSVWSESGNSVTLFLQDTTYDDDPFFSGFISVCDKVKDENFFLAIVYHEWFIIEPVKEVFE